MQQTRFTVYIHMSTRVWHIYGMAFHTYIYSIIDGFLYYLFILKSMSLSTLHSYGSMVHLDAPLQRIAIVVSHIESNDGNLYSNDANMRRYCIVVLQF